MKPNPNGKKQKVPPLAASAQKPHGSEPKKQNGSSFFAPRSLALSLIFLLSLVAIRHIKSYSNFFEKHIVGSYADIEKVKTLPDYEEIETRKELRWTRAYGIVKQLAKGVKNDPKAIVMVPPAKYIRAIDPHLEVPEPAVTYYCAGLKTAWGKTDYVYKCTHAYVVTKEGAGLIELRGKAEIDSLLNIYKDYPYTL